MSTIEQVIYARLAEELPLDHLEVINESGNHNVPEGSESHFKVTLVSDTFEGKRLLQRHRIVNTILAHQLANDIHALAIHTLTPAEWDERHGEVPLSPPCLGGSAAE